MTELINLTAVQALDRLASWQLAMTAENKSPATIACYTDATTRYLRWCLDADQPPMSRTALNTWVSDMLGNGAAPATARTRRMCVRRFAAWLTAGGSETGLMAMAGWTRSEMLIRYTRARASERAAEEAWRLNIGAI